MTRRPATADELVSMADAECDAADDLMFSEDGDYVTPGRRAVKLYRAAARLSPDPERGRLYLRACEVAEALELHGTVVSIVREACRFDPDLETVDALRGHWCCCNWRGEPFPEPPPAGSLTLMDRKGPIPGQMVLFPTEAPRAQG